MANNGSFSTSAYDGRYLTFSWSVNVQSIENNQTTINWRVTGAGGNSYTWYMAGNFKVVINGSTVYSSSGRIQLYNGTEVASGQYTISHNGDGSGSFSANCEAGIYYYAVNCYGNGSWELPTIARATQPSLSRSELYFGESVTIGLPRASSNFTHTVEVWVDRQLNATVLARNVGDSFTWTIPKSWALYTPTQGERFVIRVTTYSGSTQIGSRDSPPLKVKPTSDIAPVVNIQLTDESENFARFGGFVRGQSRIRAKVTEQLYQRTTVQSRSLTLDGITYQSNEQVSEVITSRYQNVIASVTDARGMTGTKEVTPVIFDWWSPMVVQFAVNRCDKQGMLDEEGNFVKLTYQVNIASVNNKNTGSIRYGLKKQSDANYTYRDIRMESDTKSGELVVPASGEYSWDAVIEVRDAFATTSLTRQVGTASVLMDFHRSGKGMAIGKVSEDVNVLELSPKWQLKVSGKMLDEYVKQVFLTMYPVGSVWLSFNNIDPGTFIGGRWERFGQGRTLVGVDDWDRDFSTSDKKGGSKSLPLPIVGGQNIGNTPVYLDTSVMSRYGSRGRGWDVHSSNEIKPSVDKPNGYDKLQPYVTVYMWKRIS